MKKLSFNYIKLIIPTLILLYCTSCLNQNKPSKNETLKLINYHKDSLLFLSFWPNMSDQEFQQIIDYENSEGNLVNNKFILKLEKEHNSDPSEYIDIPFEISKYYNGITLSYVDEEWWPSPTGNQFPPGQEGTRDFFYDNIKYNLVKLLDSKYQIIEPEKLKDSRDQNIVSLYDKYRPIDKKENEKKWKSKDLPEKLISLFIYKYIYKNRYYDINDIRSGKINTTPIIAYYDEKKGYKISSCRITINYELYEVSLKNQARQEEGAKRRKIYLDSIKEKKRLDALKHNNSL